MSDYVQHNCNVVRFRSADSWVILTGIEQRIKEKIESIGTPLKDWNIQINYGIKTGLNDAFVISTEKRDEILEKCTSEDERNRTADIIRPILRGRDIKRYGHDWAGLYLIATFPSRHYDIDDFPSLKRYLLDFGKERLEQTGKKYIIDGSEIKARKKTSNQWFETQDSISYWDLFFQPKICWKAVGRNLAFSLVDSGIFLTAPASFISGGQQNKLILAFLCSDVGRYFIYKNSDTTGAGDIMLNIQSLVKFPIPRNLPEEDVIHLCSLVDRRESGEVDVEVEINDAIFSAYHLSEDERKYISSL